MYVCKNDVGRQLLGAGSCEGGGGGGAGYGSLWMVMMSSSDALATQQMTDEYISLRVVAHTYIHTYTCIFCMYPVGRK